MSRTVSFVILALCFVSIWVAVEGLWIPVQKLAASQITVIPSVYPGYAGFPDDVVISLMGNKEILGKIEKLWLEPEGGTSHFAKKKTAEIYRLDQVPAGTYEVKFLIVYSLFSFETVTSSKVIVNAKLLSGGKVLYRKPGGQEPFTAPKAVIDQPITRFCIVNDRVYFLVSIAGQEGWAEERDLNLPPWYDGSNHCP